MSTLTLVISHVAIAFASYCLAWRMAESYCVKRHDDFREFQMLVREAINCPRSDAVDAEVIHAQELA